MALVFVVFGWVFVFGQAKPTYKCAELRNQDNELPLYKSLSDCGFVGPGEHEMPINVIAKVVSVYPADGCEMLNVQFLLKKVLKGKWTEKKFVLQWPYIMPDQTFEQPKVGDEFILPLEEKKPYTLKFEHCPLRMSKMALESWEKFWGLGLEEWKQKNIRKLKPYGKSQCRADIKSLNSLPWLKTKKRVLRYDQSFFEFQDLYIKPENGQMLVYEGEHSKISKLDCINHAVEVSVEGDNDGRLDVIDLLNGSVYKSPNAKAGVAGIYWGPKSKYFLMKTLDETGGEDNGTFGVAIFDCELRSKDTPCQPVKHYQHGSGSDAQFTNLRQSGKSISFDVIIADQGKFHFECDLSEDDSECLKKGLESLVTAEK